MFFSHKKLCATCNEYKPLSQFHADTKSPDGKKKHCGSCTNADARKRHAKRKKKLQDQREKSQALPQPIKVQVTREEDFQVTTTLDTIGQRHNAAVHLKRDRQGYYTLWIFGKDKYWEGTDPLKLLKEASV